MEGRNDGQALFHRTLPATTGGQNKKKKLYEKLPPVFCFLYVGLFLLQSTNQIEISIYSLDMM